MEDERYVGYESGTESDLEDLPDPQLKKKLPQLVVGEEYELGTLKECAVRDAIQDGPAFQVVRAEHGRWSAVCKTIKRRGKPKRGPEDPPEDPPQPTQDGTQGTQGETQETQGAPAEAQEGGSEPQQEPREAAPTPAGGEGNAYSRTEIPAAAPPAPPVVTEPAAFPEPQCRWSIRATYQEDTGLYRLNHYERVHLCKLTLSNQRSATLDVRLIRASLEQVVKRDPTATPRQIIDYIKTTTQVEATYHQGWTALQAAREAVFGKCEASYGKLQAYVEKMRQVDPAATTRFMVAEDNTFYRMAIVPSACVAAFRHGPPVLALDGTWTKGAWRHVLLCANYFDFNHNLNNLGTALVDEFESTDVWVWFLEALVEADPRLLTGNIVITSDRAKGLIAAVERVIPRAWHMWCTQHLKRNLIRNCGAQCVPLYKKMAHAGCPSDFHVAPEQMKARYRHAYVYLMGDVEAGVPSQVGPPSRWVRCFAPHRRFGIMTNNANEIFNNAIMKERNKTALECIHGILEWQATKMYERQVESAAHTDHFNAYANKELDHRLTVAFRHKAVPQGPFRGLVTDTTFANCRYAVDLSIGARTCECGLFAEWNLPCSHALAMVIACNRAQPTSASKVHAASFIGSEYSTARWRLMYQTLGALPNPDKLEFAGPVLPPARPAGGGGPKRRIKSTGEPRDKGRKPPRPRQPTASAEDESQPEGVTQEASQAASEAGPSQQPLRGRTKINKCSICRQTGHNARSCKRTDGTREQPGVDGTFRPEAAGEDPGQRDGPSHAEEGPSNEGAGASEPARN
jgi:hypothetical protein